MTSEYGIFNDEGMIDGPFYSKGEAEKVMAELVAQDEPNLTVSEICPDHAEQDRYSCEECEAEELEETEDEDDEG